MRCDLIAGTDALPYAFASTDVVRAMLAPIADLEDCLGFKGGDMQAGANIDLLFGMLGSSPYYRALFHHQSTD